MEEDAPLPPTQQAEAPATEVVEKREEENSNVVARETDKKAAVTQEESRIEADVERCLQRELPRLEARIAQNIQASLERTLQTIIERSVQAAIERGSHGAVKRVLQHPTRIGNSVSRDTCPDLSLIKGARNYEWHNTQETLGSAHCILKIGLDYNKHRKPRGQARLTDWSLFRKAEDATLTAPIEKYEWAESLLGVRDRFARTLQTSEEVPAIDNHLQQRNLKRALHGFAGMDEQLVAALTSKYFCTMKDNEPVREYEGMENPDLDREFEVEETQAALMAMRRSTAPGNDNVTTIDLHRPNPVGLCPESYQGPVDIIFNQAGPFWRYYGTLSTTPAPLLRPSDDAGPQTRH
ncbi:hypothetical protein HPB49_017136 [Dermacentor silvarum]|uniref:Uncharacterized protein n=1 Tax=Dermacentor silvarum TaxID=543639 RepID=A0ACB8E2I3_DERSI|nr:hypothetical protein HPB49_017136 [Dermacentor silvarum]